MRRSPSQRCAWTHCANRTPLYSQGAERFESTFEKIYTAESLTRIPWYAIAGNHDHYGNVSAQVEYARRPDIPGNTGRWRFPVSDGDIEHTWYSFKENFDPDESDAPQVAVEFFMLDTVRWAGECIAWVGVALQQATATCRRRMCFYDV